jgi:DNA-binding transcriptional ArsR family regulator
MSDFSFISKCSKSLKALSDLNRLKILDLLFRGELCVSDMVKALKIDQPKVSHHLAILKRAGVIVDRRQGRKIIYSLHPAVYKKSEFVDKIDFGFVSVEFRLRHKEKKKKEMKEEKVSAQS